jgi:L-cystine uptake protein TcyP (sodium:dicarboxylate symporter family)
VVERATIVVTIMLHIQSYAGSVAATCISGRVISALPRSISKLRGDRNRSLIHVVWFESFQSCWNSFIDVGENGVTSSKLFAFRRFTEWLKELLS